MSRTLLAGGIGALLVFVWGEWLAAGQPSKEPPKSTEKDTPAAESTRTKLLKTKVVADFKVAVSVGEILKDFAEQVDRKSGQPVMWAYGAGFPYSQKLVFACECELDKALDELFTKVGKSGYIVIASQGNKYDGWVWLTSGDERGRAKPK